MVKDGEWFKSKASGNGNACVEVNFAADDTQDVLIRDSKQAGTGPELRFTRQEFLAFKHGAVRGEFDREDDPALAPTPA